MPSVSIIIPTKNRPADLAATLQSIVLQTVLPLEVVVVDQSCTRSFTEALTIPMRYIHDRSVTGKTAARNIGMARASGEVYLFLDDDVVLEPDFIENLVAAYTPEVSGVSGIITNYRTPPPIQRAWETIFHVGTFRDERQPLYRRAEQLRGSQPIRVKQFTGCLMSFRASAVHGSRFNEYLDGWAGPEDIDFCASLPKGSILLLTPRARLAHHRTSVNRCQDHWIMLSAQVSAYMRELHWRGIINGLWYAWLSIGYLAMTCFSSFKKGSFMPIKAWRNGTRLGRLQARQRRTNIVGAGATGVVLAKGT